MVLAVVAVLLLAQVALAQSVSLIPVATPLGVAVNSTTNRVYIGNYVNKTVTVLNGDTNAVIATISLGAPPQTIAVNQVTNRVYVNSFESSVLFIIDGATNTILATLPTGPSPLGLGVNPVTNRIYSVSTGSGSGDTYGFVKVLNGVDNSEIANIATCFRPGFLAVNSVTNRIFVTENCGGVFIVIDGATNTVIGYSSSVEALSTLAVNEVTNRVYAANDESLPTISVIDGANFLQIATITPPPGSGTIPHGVAVDSTRNLTYVTMRGWRTVLVIDGASNSVVNVIDVGNAPWNVAVNPVTNRVYATLPGSDQLAVVAFPPPVIPVTIDIIPGNPQNLIIPWLPVTIDVAILSTSTFDASNVKPSSVLFGTQIGASPIRHALRNVGGDRKKDLVLTFKLRDTGITCGETAAYLIGELADGSATIEGSDLIHTVLCRMPRPAPEE